MLKFIFSKMSLKTICFVSIVSLLSVVLIPLMIIGHHRFSNAIEQKFEILIWQSEKDLVNYIRVYDDILKYVQASVDNKKIASILSEFSALINSDGQQVDLSKLITLKNKYDMDLYVISDPDLQIINTTNAKHFGKFFTNWPHTIPWMSESKSQEIKSRLVWSTSLKRFFVYSYVNHKACHCKLEVSFDVREDIDLNSIVEHLNNIKSYNPLIRNINLYDAYGYNFHQSKHTPDDHLKSLLSEIKSRKIITTELGSENTFSRFIYIPSLNLEPSPLSREIVFAEIQYDKTMMFDEQNTLTWNFIAVFALLALISYLVSMLLSGFMTKQIVKMITQISKMAKGNLKKIENIDQKELNELAHNVNLMAKNLKVSIRESRRLANKIVDLQEMERKKIASDLHDTIGQLLISAKMKLSILDKPHEEIIIEAKKLIGLASAELRHVYDAIYPPILMELGLTEAVNWYAELFFAKNVSRNIDIQLTSVISDESKIHIFRIIQESIANVTKHSQATFFQVQVRQDRSKIYLFILNNGVKMVEGKQKAHRGFGLQSIRLRTQGLRGHLELIDQNEDEFQLSISIPLSACVQKEDL